MRFSQCGLRGVYDSEEEASKIANLPNSFNELIDQLEDAFRQVAVSSKGSRLTGIIFENWLKEQLKSQEIYNQKTPINFNFDGFPIHLNIDIAIPPKNPITIFEVKMSASAQDMLMISSLLANNSDYRIGLVTFYDMKKESNGKCTHPFEILTFLNNGKYKDRFRYFHIRNGWAEQMNALCNWCKEASASKNNNSLSPSSFS